MSFADTINQQAETSGGDWVKLREQGDAIVGDLLDITERPKTWEGQQVLSRKGNPRNEWIITLRVTPTSDEDDGIRKVPAPETLQWAIQNHLKDTGVRFPSTWGGRLGIGVKKAPESPTSQVEVEDWSINYTPPATGTAAAINAAVDAAPSTNVDPFDGLV